MSAPEAAQFFEMSKSWLLALDCSRMAFPTLRNHSHTTHNHSPIPIARRNPLRAHFLGSSAHHIAPPTNTAAYGARDQIVEMVVQTIEGIVTKAGVMAKTVTVTVERRLIHPKLLKVSLPQCNRDRHSRCASAHTQAPPCSRNTIADACISSCSLLTFCSSSLLPSTNTYVSRLCFPTGNSRTSVTRSIWCTTKETRCPWETRSSPRHVGLSRHANTLRS